MNNVPVLTKEEYEARVAPFIGLIPVRTIQTSAQRQCQQRRKVDALFPQEIDMIEDPAVKDIVRKYGRPMSKNLVPIITEIALEIRQENSTASDKFITKEVKKRLDLVWDFFLGYFNDPMGLTEMFSKDMTREERIAWLRTQTSKPVSEHEVEEFFFAYICIALNDWDQDDVDMKLARWCYVRYIDTHIDYLRECLKWHDEVQAEYSSRSEWLREWLQDKIDNDADLKVVLPNDEENS